jgi:bacillithiol system protein YtxJ
MGVLSNMFGKNKKVSEKPLFNWILLTEISQLKEIIELSNTKLIVLFKNSTRCGISSRVLSQFEKATDSSLENVAFYYLDLLKYRNISNEIATTFNVYHQSPQVLLLKNGKVVAHNSHYNIISTITLEDYI